MLRVTAVVILLAQPELAIDIVWPAIEKPVGEPKTEVVHQSTLEQVNDVEHPSDMGTEPDDTPFPSDGDIPF